LARAIVFSDLDGTLLDHETYSWRAAQAGIESLRRNGIPLVPSTSKTVAELVELAARIGFGPTAIVENGAAIAWRLGDPPEVEIIGAPYQELCAALAEIRRQLALPLVGFADVDAAGISEGAGLDPATAALAKQRHGDEPFWSERELTAAEVEKLAQAVAARGLRLARGGRYFHLTGEEDKGSAARKVIERMTTAGGGPRTAAFGDAANDVPLLETVDYPFAVRRPGGAVDPVLARVPGVRVTEGVGPVGFSEGIGTLLRHWSDLAASPTGG
jgi:mannosyl-3-phosphoglycerate phosphatase